ncbi:ABC transporter ATP-binding protein [Candidatus Wolfebacteria bacterium]|nr:ABC transporter ATP-binding protein [Candidatus Wolfebacteria bacterium]
MNENFLNETFSADRQPIIRIKNLVKEYQIYGGNINVVLQGVTLDIYAGEFLAITGHSGSGKTTLLNLIGLIDKPNSGEIWIENHNTNELSEKEKENLRLKSMGFIFQFFNLIDNYTALENIVFQLQLQGYGGRPAEEKAAQILDFLGLKAMADLYPRVLSGGEQQRIAVGRAMAKDSTIILADEPTAHLDSKNSQNIISLLRDINLRFKKTIILVTHEELYAKQADRMVVLQDGRVVKIESAKPETVLK